MDANKRSLSELIVVVVGLAKEVTVCANSEIIANSVEVSNW